MKRIILGLTCILVSYFSFSQITVTDVDLFDIGDIIHLGVDDNANINVGNVGQNQNWDFSLLQNTDGFILNILDVTGTPYDQLYPNANLCIEDGGDLIYIDKSSNAVDMLGIGDSVFQEPMMIFPLPLMYGSYHIDGPVMVLDSIVGGPIVDILLTSQGISASLLTFGSAHIADSLSIKFEMISEFNVDAEGVMTLPMGSFDALRVKTERTTSTDITVYCIDTNGGTNSGWYPLPFGNTEIETSYNWFSNNINANFSLVEVTLDSIGNPDEGVTFLTGPVNILDDVGENIFSVFPTPASYTITIQSIGVTHAILTDINGREVMSLDFVGHKELDLSNLDRGTYLLQLITKEGEITKKIILD